MIDTNEEIESFMINKKWIPTHKSVDIERLSGGVSSNVWKISGAGVHFIVKQARPELAVREKWLSDPLRILQERKAMQVAKAYLTSNVVPNVYHWDDNEHLLVMECAPDDMVVWKQELLSGNLSTVNAAQVGSMLAEFHSIGLKMSEDEKQSFDDLTYFNELRIEPFYRHLMSSYPIIKGQLETLILDLHNHRTTLVHGDFSPKNILISKISTPILLDFEVAHWGNPVFDVAFCTVHLLLKGKKLGIQHEMMEVIDAFLSAYGETESTYVAHVSALLLARMDGKSPAEYITEQLQPSIRQWALTMIQKEDMQQKKWKRKQLMVIFRDFLSEGM